MEVATEKPHSHYWKLFFILTGMCLFGAIAVLPYTLSLQANSVTYDTKTLILIGAASAIQNAIFCAVAIAIGLRISKSVGLRIPFFEGILNKEHLWKKFGPIIIQSVSLGILASIIIIALDLLFNKGIINEGASRGNSGILSFYGFLASFYGGINEEILLRLFLMSIVVWLFSKINAIKDKPITFWISIIITAIIFGIGHLPTARLLGPLTPLITTRIIVLNGIGGIVFGYLYWKKGIESAMIAHFSGDIILHAILPLFFI
jgi:membrane protease YdiL (CAAX protease family)